MSHLVFIELGGLAVGLIEQAKADGHVISFVTSSADNYIENTSLRNSSLGRVDDIYVIYPYSRETLQKCIRAIDTGMKIDAIICTVTHRISEAAEIAQEMGVKYLNPTTAKLLSNKYQTRLALNGKVRQPKFAHITNIEELEREVERLQLPVVVKPVDGFAKVNVTILKTRSDLERLLAAGLKQSKLGLGVTGSGKFIAEEFLNGPIISCESMSYDGKHKLLGFTDRLPTPEYSTVEIGGTFGFEFEYASEIWREANAILDLVGFDWGAAHIEFILTENGPCAIDINPRIAGAPMPLVMGAALNRSIYKDLINLHLGNSHESQIPPKRDRFGCIRWLLSRENGILKEVNFPASMSYQLYTSGMLKKIGQDVVVAEANSDRIAYVITSGDSRAEASSIAEKFLNSSIVKIETL